MAQQQSSRLNRLLTLLDTGSTSATRRSAARQIGEIAKQHPSELQPLLKRVRQFLRSKSWETRVAAAQAIGAIAENVNHVTVKELLDNAAKELEKKSGFANLDILMSEGWKALPQSASVLAFNRFDIQKVLEFGGLLLASRGQEYDVSIDNTKSSAERLARQKQNLRRRLGLDVCEQFMDVNDMIRDEDLMHRSFGAGSSDGYTYHQQGRQEVQQLVANMTPGPLTRTLSVREKNMLKRKAKGIVKDGSKEDQELDEPSAKRAKAVITEQTHQNDKLVMESVLEEDGSDFCSDGQWPFSRFVDLLIHDIFDPVWEIRHGSIMALREILSVHAACAGVATPEVAAASSVEKIADQKLLDQKPLDQKPLHPPVLEREIEDDNKLDLNKDLKVEDGVTGNGVEDQVMTEVPAVKTELKIELPKVKEELDLNHSMEENDAIPQPSTPTSVVIAQQAWAANTEFLQDCTIRLLCVFALDRFGDFVSDQVVAPVRETCAQALGAVLKQMHPVLVHETLSILLQMQRCPEWEVRHGSLLGIKYLIAVRQELVHELLPRVLPACMAGLEDADDDVRAVAAEALLPAASAIISHAGHAVNTILLLLWDILLDLDDLSPSTSSVMHLLAELYSQREVVLDSRPLFDLNETVAEDQSQNTENLFSLSVLAPRLWPFMRHNISSVRHAAIRTLERLLEAGSMEETSGTFWALPILGDTLRLVFQNLLMESDTAILKCSGRVWSLLVKYARSDLESSAVCYFSSWLKLASTASGAPLESSRMFSPNSLPRRNRSKAVAKLHATKGVASEAFQQGHNEHKHSETTFSGKVVVGADNEKSVVQMRVATASALGGLAANVPDSMLGVIIEALREHLASQSGVQRQVASLVLVSWFKELQQLFPDKLSQVFVAVKPLYSRLQLLLTVNESATPTPESMLPYLELVRTYGKMRGEAAALLRHSEGLKASHLSDVPPVETMTVEAAIDMAMKISSAPEVSSGATVTDEAQSSARDIMESSRQRLLATAGYLKCVQGNLHVSVVASLAGAAVWMGELPTKLNPIIQPLMAAVKREQEEVLQQLAAEALAEVIAHCVGRKPCPNDKLIKNTSTLACADQTETPIATEANAVWGSFDDAEFGASLKSGVPQKKSDISSIDERSKLDGIVTRRGAEFALKALCCKFGSLLFDKLPKLWDCLTEAIKPCASTDQDSFVMELKAEPQSLINNLQLIRAISPFVKGDLQQRILTLLPSIFGCVRHPHAAVRLAASRCVTAMATSLKEPVMAAVLSKAIPMLVDASSVDARQGAGMLVTFLVDGLGVELVAYAPLLIVPLLGCMSDSNPIVRQSVTHSFAALVPLLPLARGVAQPEGLSESQALKSAEDSKFLDQLLDNTRVDDYKLSFDLTTTLRRYQQEGINWLAFLKRFKLHGVLCDDMGLGKTLQACAIVASDTVELIAAARSPVQSLIVCPPTLVGHWVYEIEKFIPSDVLKPLQYSGSPQDRTILRNQFASHNIIITSYDVLRKDIEHLSQLLWNYCILDEGHVIKSAKSKITLAVKRIQAEHRLILTGTPIQNNVLELWSLFDFLMPGFLGSERQFHTSFGKPLLAARDSKCSAKEAEAGVLAMEALHKQVMPFLLRRTKDEVLSDLPPKIIQDRYCDLSPLQLKLYDNFSRSQAKKEVSSLVEAYGGVAAADSSSTSSSTHIFQALQYLRKLCSHPLLVSDGSLPVELLDSTASDLHDLNNSPKLLALREILEECGIGQPNGNGDSTSSSSSSSSVSTGQHRVLIFAQLKGFLDIIEKDLFQTHMKSVTYMRLDGSVETEKRFDIVKAFNSDPTIDVLLLTTHVGGLGLNLTAADTVVFMEHDWNPMRDLQAMDRAHRLGQKRVVNVHRLIMRGTLEEKVMGLQRFKLSVANTIINSENASLNTMNTGQLLDLFTVSSDKKATASASKEEEAVASSSSSSGVGGGKGLKAMLNSLEDLWDQSQYSEEYNLGQFVGRLRC